MVIGTAAGGRVDDDMQAVAQAIVAIEATLLQAIRNFGRIANPFLEVPGGGQRMHQSISRFHKWLHLK